jgi:hypothetical protein
MLILQRWDRKSLTLFGGGSALRYGGDDAESADRAGTQIRHPSRRRVGFGYLTSR